MTLKVGDKVEYINGGPVDGFNNYVPEWVGRTAVATKIISNEHSTQIRWDEPEENNTPTAYVLTKNLKRINKEQQMFQPGARVTYVNTPLGGTRSSPSRVGLKGTVLSCPSYTAHGESSSQLHLMTEVRLDNQTIQNWWTACTRLVEEPAPVGTVLTEDDRKKLARFVRAREGDEYVLTGAEADRLANLLWPSPSFKEQLAKMLDEDEDLQISYPGLTSDLVIQAVVELVTSTERPAHRLTTSQWREAQATIIKALGTGWTGGSGL